MVREALIRELAGRFLKILQEVEGADQLSISEYMGICSIVINQITADRKGCRCVECESKPDLDESPSCPSSPTESVP